MKMGKNIKEVEFTIFDTETTGLNPESGHRIIEIAAIRFKANTRKAIFQSLVNPQRVVSDGAFAVNRISQDMLVNAPKIEEVMPKFLDFIQGSCLCSYNASFDLGFLRSELKIIGGDFPKGIVVVDILFMARQLLPQLERHALWFVSQSLGIKEEQEHRALGDAEASLEVFNKLIRILETKGIVNFEDFILRFGFKG